MTTTALISKFNALDGKKVSKATLIKLQKAAVTLSQSKGDTANTINKRVTAAIQQMNGKKSINIKLSEPVKEEKISKKEVVSRKKKVAKKKPALTVIPESAASQESHKPKIKTAKPQGDSHAPEKTEAQNDDTKKASVTSKEAKKPNEKSPKSKKRLPRAKKSPRNDVKKPTLSGLPGFTRADQAPSKPEGELFTLPGEVGKWLGEQQHYRLVISMDGETHAGKSELAKKIVNAMASHGFNTAWLDMEQGGMESEDTRESINRNITPENQKRVFVDGNSYTKQQIEDLINKYPAIDVIALDSATKVKTGAFNTTNEWMEDLRTRYPKIIWIPIWQQNAQGGTRGGSSVNFDAPVHIKVYRPDHTDYKANYAEFLKNRGNSTDKRFRLHDNKIMDINPATDE